MLVAGGCYRETCESPHWNALFGSGGRAAAAVVNLGSQVDLHTYSPPGSDHSLDLLRALGIRVHAAASGCEIAFAYFHPLSRPSIAPERSTITQEAPLLLHGGAVLRFGFMEGDAIVTADRAVYDPQTRLWPSFSANGSRAGDLALVLNEAELVSRAGHDDLNASAKDVMGREGASVVVTKCGARGAYVHELARGTTWIPPYASQRVFKIGSGDVFSASFAHYWAQEGMEPVQAADLASKSVASYVGTRQLPLPLSSELTSLRAVGSESPLPVHVFGSTATLAGRWLLEEARWCLQELGLRVYTPALGSASDGSAEQPGAVLVLADFVDLAATGPWEGLDSRVPQVWLREAGHSIQPPTIHSHIMLAEDFATAIYWSAWAASV